LKEELKKMEIEKYLESDNWFNYQKFYDFISQKNYETLVEVGVWKGHSISYLANKNKSSKIWAVDLFEDTTDDYYQNESLKTQIPFIYEIYNMNLIKSNVRNNIIDIKGDSYESANKFTDESIDFVFIDANHEYDKVVSDIDVWYKKIKYGGIISGHDYGAWPGVTQAVDEFVQKNKLNLQTDAGYVWYCYKK
jgi:predicted O-methyltransferase YrrM